MRRQTKSASRARLRVEPFEDRCVPAVIPVTSPLDDAGQRGTLRWALARAGDGDTILLTPAVGAAGITLTQGELLVKHNVTITGVSNSNPVTISGGGQSRVFEIAGGASVAIADVTITGGNAQMGNADYEGRGGGVVVDVGGSLAITDSTVTGNMALRGGGIDDFGALTVNRCTVSDNQALYQGPAGLDPGSHYGGGIAVFSGDPFSPLFTATATITNSTVSGNTALENGGGIAGVASTVTVDHCVVTGNTATEFNGGGLNNHYGIMTVSHSRVDDNKVPQFSVGGGMFNDGTDFHSHFVSTLTVTDCDVDGNTAGFGAGVYNAGTLTLSDSRLTNNVTVGDWGYGGGVIIWYRATAALQNDVITGNSANDGGGVWSAGTTTISASKIDNNTAARTGGGIITEDGSLTVENSEINNNDNSTGWGGGGLYVDYGTVTLSHCDISGNTSGWDGGGIFNWDTLTLTDCTLSGDTAADAGGGVFNYGILTADGCTVSGNSAPKGGGIANEFGGWLSVANSTFVNNSPQSLFNFFGVFVDGGGNSGL
jgi:hypothetical protein